MFDNERDCKEWELVSSAIRQLRGPIPDYMEVPDELMAQEGQEFLEALLSKDSLSTRFSDIILERARGMKKLADRMFPAD